MDRFPSDFDDLLNARGRRLLADPPQLEALLAKRRTPIVLLENVIDGGVARDCIRLLDSAIYPELRRMHTPIPAEALIGMRRNYSERLPKTVRVKTATFNSRRSRMLEVSTEIGLAGMLQSPSFTRLAQSVTSPPLRTDRPGRQVICYEAGDYSGPHNDHHPQRREARNGFIDLHIMFSNDDVASQWLVYEDRGFLSAAHDVSSRAAIAIYRLPFWHYTTPLVAKPRREASARRWLLLGSFDYDPPLKKLAYRA
jgi:hypothetical protein